MTIRIPALVLAFLAGMAQAQAQETLRVGVSSG